MNEIHSLARRQKQNKKCLVSVKVEQTACACCTFARVARSRASQPFVLLLQVVVDIFFNNWTQKASIAESKHVESNRRLFALIRLTRISCCGLPTEIMNVYTHRTPFRTLMSQRFVANKERW